MTDAEQKRCVRLLRFPKPLENDFQEHYFLRNRTFVRICLVGLLLWSAIPLYYEYGNISFVGFISQVLYNESFRNNVLNDGVLHEALGFAILFGVSFHRRKWQWFYPVVVGLAVVEALFSNNGTFIEIARFLDYQPHVSTPGSYLDLNQHLVVWIGYAASLHIIQAVMYMLPARWTAIYLLTTAGIVLQALALSHLPQAIVLEVPIYHLVPLAFLMWTVSYFLERSARGEFIATRLLKAEQAKSEKLLLNVLPSSVAERLKEDTGAIADHYEETSVLFADLVNFTPFAADKPAREVVEYLNSIFSRLDRLVEQYGLEKIKTIGDCYMVIAGAPTPRVDHLQSLARFALVLQTEADQMSQEHDVLVRFRVGLHTGPLIAGVIGEKRFLYDVWGDTVNIASRLESHGLAGKIQVSVEVARKLQGQFTLIPRGQIEIKGKGMVKTYFLEGEHVPAGITDDPSDK